ncbi:MAG: helix-turn-helix domain-containing protein [Bacteroidia bacterium]|nr:helix-turn-helix domain-containing protein [Bacteroidia bacterium]
MHLSDLVKLIKERRETLKLSQEDLAGISGVGLRTLKQMESNKGNPTLKTILKLLDVLGMELVLGIKKSKLLK